MADPPQTLVRWSAAFAPEGATPRRIPDATTTEEASRWAREIRTRLDQAGYAVRLSQDEGEDGDGNPVLYDELSIPVPDGITTLSFFVDEVSWFVEAFTDEAHRGKVMRISREIRDVVESVTGYRLRADDLLPEEAAMLDRA